MTLTGRKFGRWTVLSSVENSPKRDRKWLCQCECGTVREVRERSLVYGGSLSCGCLQKENSMKSLGHDLSFKQFGDLKVIDRASKKSHGGLWWLCECTCGKRIEVSGTLLKTGRKTHCGCKSHSKTHFVDLTGRKFQRLTALYPTEMRSSKGSIIWHCGCECGNEVDVDANALMHTNIQSCGCKKKEHDIQLQSWITRVDGTSVDMIKSHKIPKNSSTGVKGVCFSRGKYIAKIVFQKKQYHLGSYDSFEEACEARKQAEQLLFHDTVEMYELYQKRAEKNPEWALEHPFQIIVTKKSTRELNVQYLPELI